MHFIIIRSNVEYRLHRVLPLSAPLKLHSAAANNIYKERDEPRVIVQPPFEPFYALTASNALDRNQRVLPCYLPLLSLLPSGSGKRRDQSFLSVKYVLRLHAARSNVRNHSQRVFPRRLPLPTILTDNADKQIDEPCDERR